MELSQLQAFVAVAEAGGFSRAASLLASTQPTLSRQVKALEQHLGRSLFDRLGRRIELTSFGRECLEKARAILAMSEALERSAEAHGARATGVLRLGVADSVVLRRFPPILKRFQERNAAVRVRVRTSTSTDILSWVREGRCDAGLCMVPQSHPELLLRELWIDPFVCIVPADHPLAGGEAELAAFARERMIAIAPGTLSHQVLTAAFHAEGLSLVPEMTFDDFQLIVDLVHAKMGVGIVSSHVAANALREGKVAAVRCAPIDGLRRSIGLALHAERQVDGALGAFVAEIDRIEEASAGSRR
jgi:DNA-binding transcriptional LysR family regulator